MEIRYALLLSVDGFGENLLGVYIVWRVLVTVGVWEDEECGITLQWLQNGKNKDFHLLDINVKYEDFV
ncbi:unnamed protein product, partial [Sphenostylis stenocarpa]